MAEKYSGVKVLAFILMGLEDSYVGNIKRNFKFGTDSFGGRVQRCIHTPLQFRGSWRRVRMRLVRLCTATFFCALSGPTQGILHWICKLQTLLGKFHNLKTFRLRCRRKPSTVNESFCTHIQSYKNVI